MKIRNVFAFPVMALLGASCGLAQNAALTSFSETSLPGIPNVNIERVFYEDYTNNIQGLGSFGPPGISRVGDLTVASGAAPAFSGTALTSFADSFTIHHVFYIDYLSNVHEIYKPYDGSIWYNNQLTQGATGAPPVQDAQTQIASCFDNHNIEHVFYIDEYDHVVELYNNGRWWSNDLTAQTGTAGAIPRSYGNDLGSGLTAFCDPSGNANVFYTSSLGGTELLHINYLHFDGSHWSNTDLTAQTNGPIAAAADALTSFMDSFGIRHVFYFATDHSVRELYQMTTNGSWFGNDLSGGTGSPVAYERSAITSFFDTNRIEHVFYIDQNSQVRELYNDGRWQTNDLSERTGSPIPSFGGGLSSFYDGTGEHVFYTDAEDDIVELYFNGGNWRLENLTTASGAPLATP